MAEIQPIKLRFSARAHSQLLAIHEYTEKRNPAAAARIGTNIRHAAEVLRYFPYSGRQGRSPGTREWLIRRSPYVMVYEIDAGEDILGVFHRAQKRD